MQELPGSTETFIKAHIDELQPRFVYTGAPIPQFVNKRRLQPFFKRAIRKVAALVKNETYWHDEIAFEKHLKKHSIEVLLAEYGVVGAYIYKICQRLGVKLIVHFHGYDASMKSVTKRLGNEYRAMFEVAHKVMAVSTEMKSDLDALGCDPEKISINPYGPNEEFYKVTPNYQSQNIVSLGRFTEKKAPQVIVEAFARILKTFPDARLRMIGEGELKKKCEEQVIDLGLENQVEFLGLLSMEHICHVFQDSSIFVQHSVQAQSGDKEGSPVAIMEAAAAGLPIVSTRHAGIVETVIEEETGYLCDEHDVQTFSDNLKEMLEQKSKREQMGKAGRVHIKANFSRQKHIACLKQLVSKAI
ncbi:glycosyltransferase [Marinoscillum sp.]|uniref:glycosyltransferase n=1 Tax=Marinoscillum sp. TaxID=2024838 RepID=UPI003BABB014